MVEKEEPPRETSFHNDETHISEQIEGSGFACYNRKTGEVVYVPFIVDKGTNEKIVPLDPHAVNSGVIVLPTEAAEYSNDEELLDGIVTHIHRWLDISPSMERFAAYYVLYSWLYDKFNTAPYLRVTGDTGSGKTRFLDTIGRICYKPILVSGAATSSPIFRLLERWAGTLVIDEADFAKSDTTQDIIKIFNSGFERFRPVIRCDRDNPNNIEIHRVFGPKVISSRYKFFDAALESRCLAEQIRPTTRHIKTNLTADFFEEEKALRNKLLMYRFKNYDRELVAYEGELNIEPRLEQMVSSFLAILHKDEAMLAKFKEFIAEYQKQLIEDRAETNEGAVAIAIHHFYEKGVPVTPSEVAEFISSGVPKAEQLGPRKVGRVIKSLGLEVKVARMGMKTARVVTYNEQILDTIFRRYIPNHVPKSCYDVTFVTSYADSHPPAGQNPLSGSEVELQKISRVNVSHVTNVTTKQLLGMMSKHGGDVTPVSVATMLQENGMDADTLRASLQELSGVGEVTEVTPGYWMLRRPPPEQAV